MAPPFQFAVEFVEKDVRQQRLEWVAFLFVTSEATTI
jgi:hypothetical protein